MSIPEYNEWMTRTGRGMLARRSAELKAIDDLLLKYGKATSPYGKEWTANELRIALEIWKKANGANWKTNERNNSGIIQKLDDELPAKKVGRIGSGSAVEGETAQGLRHSVLFFLANCTTSPIPTDVTGFLNDGTDTSADVHKLAATGTAAGWKFYNGSFWDADNKRNSFLDDVIERLVEYVKELAKATRNAATSLLGGDGGTGSAVSWMEGAVEFIRAALPQLLIDVLGAVLSRLKTVIAVVKGLKQAGEAAVGIYATRYWQAGVLKGAPSEIVKAVRDQIEASGYDGIKSAVKAAVLAGLGAIPGAGDVIGIIANAIASVYAFVTKVFTHFTEIRHLKQVIGEAKTHLTGKLYETADAFNDWFKKTIAMLPIISSYCMTLPLTGSYYGFLTLVATDGSELAYKQLERNYTVFNDVKTWAKKFVTGHDVRLYSTNKVVQHSLTAARGEQKLWDNIKAGLGDRALRTSLGMVKVLATT